MTDRREASNTPIAPSNAGVEDRLDSWKEIAAYLRRGVRTVKRWEKEEGLPVHRHLHQRLGTVYASKAEVDAWMKTRGHPMAPANQEEVDVSTRPSLRSAPAVMALAIGAIAIVMLGYVFVFRGAVTPPATGRMMIAVLPFENLSGDAEQEFFSDGLTEEMITELGRLHPVRLGVIARTSSMLYKGAKKSIGQVATELHVDYLLDGSVRRDGDRVRISAQLIRGNDQTNVWAQNYDRELRGIVDVQSEVVRAIAERIQIALDPQVTARRSRAVNPSAYEAALRGRYFLERRTADDLRKARGWFERAIALDSTYALPYVGLADAHILSTTYADRAPSGEMPEARQAVLHALELDGDLPAAHASLGIIMSEYDWDWNGAGEQLRRAIDLNPSFSDAHERYSEYLSYIGRFDAAITEARLARRLDPLSVVNNALVGLVLYRARRYDEALVELKQAIEMDPAHPTPYLPLGLTYSMKDQHRDAVAALEKSVALAPESSELVAQLALAHGRAGEADTARLGLAKLRERSRSQHVSPFSFALVHTSLGESQTALDWLDQAYKEHDWYLCVLKTEPIFDPLRSNPRFQDLLRRMNFPL
jgi:TolB-like protein/Tfp pilus assembly protein PilF